MPVFMFSRGIFGVFCVNGRPDKNCDAALVKRGSAWVMVALPAATMPLFVAALNLAAYGEEGAYTAVQLYIVATVLLALHAGGASKTAWFIASPIVVLSVGGMLFELVAPRLFARHARRAQGRRDSKQRAQHKHVEARGVNELVERVNVEEGGGGGDKRV